MYTNYWSKEEIVRQSPHSWLQNQEVIRICHTGYECPGSQVKWVIENLVGKSGLTTCPGLPSSWLHPQSSALAVWHPHPLAQACRADEAKQWYSEGGTALGWGMSSAEWWIWRTRTRLPLLNLGLTSPISTLFFFLLSESVSSIWRYQVVCFNQQCHPLVSSAWFQGYCVTRMVEEGWFLWLVLVNVLLTDLWHWIFRESLKITSWASRSRWLLINISLTCRTLTILNSFIHSTIYWMPGMCKTLC